ncbi:BQ5605_C022g09582 [Microbotryum silenes-dioicae]|uniref:BQ5605_C002g00992 protein n=1 Tax=Microbotryum silenes-dioicae TaxID=796604 RepID=A0A2X0M1C8_9BASI|nr:BQ5605_C002g00992 [Microbotryum silenes-dioicae]SGZ23071.1 BQ5605_C022g09582 [Microbotryum silenes-dioicae]
MLELTQGCSHAHDEIVQGFIRAWYYAIPRLHICSDSIRHINQSLLRPVSVDLHPPKHHRPSLVFQNTASCRSGRYRRCPSRACVLTGEQISHK